MEPHQLSDSQATNLQVICDTMVDEGVAYLRKLGCGIWLFYLFGPSGLCDFAFLSFTLRGAIHSSILSVVLFLGGWEGSKEHQNAEVYENYNIKLRIYTTD